MGKHSKNKGGPAKAKAIEIDKDEEGDDQEPDLAPIDSGKEDDEESVYDSEDGLHHDDDEEESNGDDDDDDYAEESNDDEDLGEEEFEDQGSSDDDDDLMESQQKDDGSDDEIAISYERLPRTWSVSVTRKKKRDGQSSDQVDATALMHTDDWSSDEDDEEGKQNRIGRVPLHWYDEYDHIGYDAHGEKVIKTSSLNRGDRIDQALAMQDNLAKGKFVVHDALNDRDVELSQRQLELIRRVQAGAFAHPEHDANPDYVDYFSGVNPEISGLGSNVYEPKARFQPSKWEKMQVDKLLEKLNKGFINMDYLTGKIRDMNEVNKPDPKKPFLMWTGDEEDELNMKKGPQHIAAPKLPPPGHAESYIPPDEYLPTEEDLKKWEEMEPKDRPYGHMIPKKFPNLRSVGAYEHSVREAFERCLDLYLCPRVLKRRLNIDPESLVPRLPKASDLRPFPTAKCIEYKTPYDGDVAPIIRCIAVSPDGQFIASGASDGFVRLWEVQTARLLRSWNLSALVGELDYSEQESEKDGSAKPVVCIDWNPNRSHHCLIAAVGNFIVVIASGTAGENVAEITEALLASASSGGDVSSEKAKKVVKWFELQGRTSKSRGGEQHQQQQQQQLGISSFDRMIGPVCALKTTAEISCVRWQAKGDYFLSVSPKAGAAAVLIHQLSKGNSQQPFSKAKGEAQVACFHPNKPFLFVASQQHIRIYHLVKQNMVKRLVTGCRWISSLDVHPSGDHLIVGTLDRRMVWFDLDLSATPYKTLKYHERAIRTCKYHGRYPLMASGSDDGTVHIFHSMVYSDLMRNPLIVPVKILRGHSVTNKLGVLTVVFHPTQPWIFTGGADGKIILFQDI